MSFFKRLFGGGESPVAPAADETRSAADEAARERELLLAEARRLDDDLIQRQLRYADRSWTPPPQGGERRADDEDAQAEGG
jgi:hypothetical protein